MLRLSDEEAALSMCAKGVPFVSIQRHGCVGLKHVKFKRVGYFNKGDA